MIRHFFNTAFRHFYRTRAFSLINIVGLSMGISVALLLFIWMQHESSYDQFHVQNDRIYRIIKGEITDEDAWTGMPSALADHLGRLIPEIESYVRVINRESILQANEKTFNEENTFLVDSNFFEIFSFQLLTGNANSVFNDPYSIVLTWSTVEKYFGDLNPIGQMVRLGDTALKITGIAADPPANSHFHFDVLARFDLFYEKLDDQYMNCWGCFNFTTYLLLNKNADPQSVEAKIREFTVESEGNTRTFESLNLQPLTDIHYEYIRGNFEPVFSRKYIAIYSALIFIILIMASVNYINLNVAIAPIRFKEVGIKKTFGANRIRLSIQFMAESVLATLIAFFMAVILSEIFLPSFNRLIGKQLDFQSTDPPLIGLLTFLAIILGLFIGIYPALYTSSASVSRILQGIGHQGKRSWIRNSLVVFQFIISVIFILSAIVLNKQLHFIRHQHLGFDREHVINISFFPTGIHSQEDLEMYQRKTGQYKNSLENHTAIQAITLNNFVPSTLNRNHGISFEGQEQDQSMSVFVISGDRDFMDTYQIDLISGQEKIANFEFNGTFGYILNQSAVNALGWDQPIDKFFSIFGPGKPGRVIGVCRDFHYRSFHHEIGPCVVILGEPGGQVSFRLSGDQTDDLINYARKEYARIFPDTPFEYFFVDDDFDLLYKSEIRTIGAITVFTLISMIIACLGLYGLASYYTVQRTKEIGIRKVMGAERYQIILMFFKEISLLILFAIVIGVPVSLILANNWLRNFAYKTEINWWVILMAVFSILVISWITIGYQTLRAAGKNPVNTLRYE